MNLARPGQGRKTLRVVSGLLIVLFFQSVSRAEDPLSQPLPQPLRQPLRQGEHPLGLKLQRVTEENKLPLWELGVGIFAFQLPHYRGASQNRDYFWPIPYFIYRGEVVHAENTGISGNFYETDNFSLGLSLNASLRVNSGDNNARAGMPNLDPSFEIGPMASWDFWKDQKKDAKNILSLNVPLRQVVALDFFRIDPIGYFIVPFLAWTAKPQPLTLGLLSEISLAAMYGSQHYHNYYYGIDPQFATAGRPSYTGERGYSGSHATWYLSKKITSLDVFAFIRYDYLKGATFEKSPLYKRRDYVAFGGGFIFYAFKSSEFSKRKKDSPGPQDH